MFIIDTEVYKNYFLLSMLRLSDGKIRHFEFHADAALDVNKIKSLFRTETVVSFNGNSYDIPIISAAIAGYSNQHIKDLSDAIIKSNQPSWTILRSHNFDLIKTDHIDLIEVAPGQSSLKIYGGRMNAPKMQDLPIEPNASISPEQRAELREYCENDLHTTAMLYKSLKPQIDLRIAMSTQYGMDLRSKSDAQIAETIIVSEMTKITGEGYGKVAIKDNAEFSYLDPTIVSFNNPELNALIINLCTHRFTLGLNGAVKMPDWLRDTKIKIGTGEYQMGIGGLHSCEKSQYIKADDDHILLELDVASYYPNIILQQRLAPKSMGAAFLRVYQEIVTRRLKAKHEGDKVTADVLKIAVNGSFGKLGSKYSALFAPELLIQTTITGQLALLMLIETVELAGAKVVSANTDGVVILCPRKLEKRIEEVAFDWMLRTSFDLERTDYRALASRDVNSYVAVKLDGKIKGKGVFAGAGLAKNPDDPIIAQSVAQYVAHGIPLEITIRNCRDITQFVTIRRVQGGATWQGQYLGKAVRFYHSNAVPSAQCIHYATNSNRVPNSAGSRPLMQLPDTFPEDVDYNYYLVEAEKLLCEVGL